MSKTKSANGQIVGYARVSTTQNKQDASLATQCKELKAAGAEKIFKEKISGAAKDRPEFDAMLDYVRDGDVIITSKLDRITRSIGGLAKLLETLKDNNVGFRVLDNPTIDTTTPHGELVLSILSACAAFERQMISTRVAEGRARAVERGVKFGPKPKATDKKIQEIKRLHGQGCSGDEISKEVKLSRATVFRIIKRLRENGELEELVA